MCQSRWTFPQVICTFLIICYSIYIDIYPLFYNLSVMQIKTIFIHIVNMASCQLKIRVHTSEFGASVCQNSGTPTNGSITCWGSVMLVIISA